MTCRALSVVQLEWTNPDVDGLVQFLVTEKGFKCVCVSFPSFYFSPFPIYYSVTFHPFHKDRHISDLLSFSEERVRKGAEKLQKFLNTKQQGRLDGFFSVKPKDKKDPKKEEKGKGKGKADAKGKGTKRKVN